MRTPFVLLALLSASPLAAQRAPLDPRRAFEISDNSFLVEEAFNQEAGVFQNILLLQPPRGGEWSVEFTQEWPVGGQRHQLSYTIPLEAMRPSAEADYQLTRGTIALNYRYQLTNEGDAVLASSPRVSLLIPRGDIADTWGLQFNLPLSKQLANFYLHANAGATLENVPGIADVRWHAAGSVIYRVFPMVHAMLESVYRADEIETAEGLEDDWLISPGLRAGINLRDHQLVLGVAVPIGMLDANDMRQLITYISYELPFMRR